MGQFFLYHILAWRSYVTFIIYLLIDLMNQLKQFTGIDSFNNHNPNHDHYHHHYHYILINIITIICLLMSTIYLVTTLSIYQYKHYPPPPPPAPAPAPAPPPPYVYIVSLLRMFMIYISTIIRLLFSLLICLLLDTIELITLHLTSFYIYATQ